METLTKPAPAANNYGFTPITSNLSIVMDAKNNLKVNSTGNAIVDALDCIDTMSPELMAKLQKEDELLYAALTLYLRDMTKGNKLKSAVEFVATIKDETLLQRVLFLLVRPGKDGGPSIGYFKDLIKIWNLNPHPMIPHMHAWWIRQDSYHAKKWMPAAVKAKYSGKRTKRRLVSKTTVPYARALMKVLGVNKSEYRRIKSTAVTTEARLSAKKYEEIIIVGKGKNVTSQNLVRLVGKMKKPFKNMVQRVLSRIESTKAQLEIYFAKPEARKLKGITNDQLQDLATHQEEKFVDAIAESSIEKIVLNTKVKVVPLVDGSSSMQMSRTGVEDKFLPSTRTSSVLAELAKTVGSIERFIRFETNANWMTIPTNSFAGLFKFFKEKVMIGGSTNFEAAVELLFQTAKEEKWDLKKCIFPVFTDEAFDRGDFGTPDASQEKRIYNVKEVLQKKCYKILGHQDIGNWIFFKMVSSSTAGNLATATQDGIALLAGNNPNFPTILSLVNQMVGENFEFNPGDIAKSLIAPYIRMIIEIA